MSQMVTQISSAHSPEALFETLHLDTFRPAELRLALLLGLASSRWRQPWRGSAKLLDAVRALRSRLARDPLLAERAAGLPDPAARLKARRTRLTGAVDALFDMRAPLDWLRWRRTRPSGQRTPRRRPPHVDFVASSLNFDGYPESLFGYVVS